MEHAHCVIETRKKSENDKRAAPKFNSDASKVTSKGLGLTKAFMNRTAQFTVDTSQAGQFHSIEYVLNQIKVKNPSSSVHFSSQFI